MNSVSSETFIRYLNWLDDIMGYHDRRDGRENKPKSATQLQKEIDDLDFRLETEALKFSEEKKLRGTIRILKKQKVLAIAAQRVNRPTATRSVGTIAANKAEVEEILVSDFAAKLKAARSAKNMTQEEFAAFLNERASELAKWENGNLKPNLSTAKGLQRKLHISLVVEAGVEVAEVTDVLKSLNPAKANKTATLGDMVKVKVRGK